MLVISSTVEIEASKDEHGGSRIGRRYPAGFNRKTWNEAPHNQITEKEIALLELPDEGWIITDPPEEAKAKAKSMG